MTVITRFAWVLVAGVAVVHLVQAQPPQPTPTEPFPQVLKEWNQLDQQIKDAAQQYRTTADPKERDQVRTKYMQLLEASHPLLERLRAAGVAAYQQAPNASAEVTETLLGILSNDVRGDDYISAGNLAKTLLDNGCKNPLLWELAGKTSFAVNDFDGAEELLHRAEKAESIDDVGKHYLAEIPACKKLWAKELELRKAEAEKDDLPRVKLTTSKGDIVIELLENKAPETVANFISLVESKFYDDKTFHRVLPGFMAQGGCPDGTGRGGPGYKIYCECVKPEARMHFQGSLSMAHAGRDTGGSQFFLTFLPTTNLNGRHTVFGRVIAGMDVLAKIQRIDPQARSKTVPDTIVKAEVVRKRDHKYEPNKVK